MTTIRETLDSALNTAGLSTYSRQSYAQYIDAVEQAFTERGYEQVEAVVAAAKEQGFGLYGRGREEELYSIVETALGQTRRPAPEPEPEVEEFEAEFAAGEELPVEGKKGKKSKALLKEILDTLGKVVVKQNEQDEALTKLKGLAQSRLGVTL